MKRALLLMLCLLSSQSIAADDSMPSGIGEISVSSVRTQLEQQAVGFALKVLPEVNVSSCMTFALAAGCITPDITLETGDKDTFQAITAKASGFLILEPPKDEDGEPDIMGWLHIFPVSVGFETDRYTNKVSAIAELGYMPVAPAGQLPVGVTGDKAKRFGFSNQRYFGVFLQGGYKFDSGDGDETEEEAEEKGALDESAEPVDEALARVKVEAAYALNIRIVSLITKGAVWYDLVNDETYYKIDGMIRVRVRKDVAFDFKLEKGSGAPNFNEGSQFVTGLTYLF